MTATTFSRQNVTRDQAQFERFSYILSNGYRWCYLQSETKIEAWSQVSQNDAGSRASTT